MRHSVLKWCKRLVICTATQDLFQSCASGGLSTNPVSYFVQDEPEHYHRISRAKRLPDQPILYGLQTLAQLLNDGVCRGRG